MPAAQLEVDNLCAGYGPTRVIENISFTAAAGSRVAVLGRNGVGKTTLFAALAGQTKRYAGTIKLDNSDLTTMDSAARAWNGLGFVPQSRAIFPSLTVEENLFVGLKGRPRSALQEAYDMFPRLYERRANSGAKLSGGEQQMLSTARTILGRPSLLLLDEPLEGLAPVICEELMAAFSRLASSGEMTILLVEQRIQSALEFAERVIILERGRIVWDGSSEQLSRDDETVHQLLGVSSLAH
ncbi:ABC transporter ATP-binding protein [Phyllobacterium myrsinacearum]|uniref:Branched-chain amino acid transport system ATP-binding protein n=1 Tax=Phyllobacterium myrsinacearum TaxID=28101 RepID=A0A839EUR9_9HYPH|nr:ABC transporter ATP-binding protein [Phyllobacterium myrsinacearum]MBA8881918.1 branched-chain amino acid transport system ATP-binding protein [Phyllobacterium myrsinacearum]